MLRVTVHAGAPAERTAANQLAVLDIAYARREAEFDYGVRVLNPAWVLVTLQPVGQAVVHEWLACPKRASRSTGRRSMMAVASSSGARPRELPEGGQSSMRRARMPSSSLANANRAC